MDGAGDGVELEAHAQETHTPCWLKLNATVREMRWSPRPALLSALPTIVLLCQLALVAPGAHPRTASIVMPTRPPGGGSSNAMPSSTGPPPRRLASMQHARPNAEGDSDAARTWQGGARSGSRARGRSTTWSLDFDTCAPCPPSQLMASVLPAWSAARTPVVLLLKERGTGVTDSFVAHYHDDENVVEPKVDRNHAEFDPFYVPMPKLKRTTGASCHGPSAAPTPVATVIDHANRFFLCTVEQPGWIQGRRSRRLTVIETTC